MVLLFKLLCYFGLVAVHVATETQGVGYFWHITDIHYDPTYETTGLSCLQEKSLPVGMFGDVWCDAPWSLVASSIKAMGQIKPDVDFVLWTGDTVLHADDSELSYDSNDVILGNVTSELRNTFGNIPVYATFGNHDYFPSDQFPPHNNAVYNATLEKWRPWIGTTSQDANFLKGGYYSVLTQHGIRVIALNTILLYKHNKAVPTEGDPADQFAWLETVLQNAKTNREKIIITAHVPVGVGHDGGLDMYEAQNERLVKLLETYAEGIVGLHFGHKHIDTFKFLRNKDGQPTAPIFIAPSVTPRRWPEIRKNPGIRLVKYEHATGRHLEIRQYYLDIQKANDARNDAWELEYDMTQAYDIDDVTIPSLQALLERMKNDQSAEFLQFMGHYYVTPKDADNGRCDSECQRKMICGVADVSKAGYERCVQRALSKATSAYTIHPTTALTLLVCSLMALSS